MEYFYPTSKIRFMSTKLPELSIHEIALERETVTKLLGIFTDENVKWKTHINTIYRTRRVILRKQ